MDHIVGREVSGRVVERKVAVLTDAEDADVRRIGLEQRCVPMRFRSDVVRVAVHLVEGAHPHPVDELFAEVVSEALRVGRVETDVLVHVEDRDLVPGDVRPMPQGGEERQLRVAAREDHRGGPGCCDALDQGVGGNRRGHDAEHPCWIRRRSRRRDRP